MFKGIVPSLTFDGQLQVYSKSRIFYCRSGNNIRHITGLSENLALKHLDLSDNTVTSLSDLSHLYALKVGIHRFDHLIVRTYIHIFLTQA